MKAYAGDGAVLLAWDVDEALRQDLAGFAIEYRDPAGETSPVFNRLNFQDPVTADTTPGERRQLSTATKDAPIQKFHWVHFPKDVTKGDFTYTVSAMRFKAGADDQVEPVASHDVVVKLMPDEPTPFELGFTRGYLSSQAYLDRFGEAPIAPRQPTIDFDTAPFEPQYRWLGFHARHLVFGFLEEAVNDPGIELDVFAFDLDEPDVIRALAKLGPRLRLLLDDSDSHTKPNKAGKLPPEMDAFATLRASSNGNVKRGHFEALAHDKIFIQRRGKVAHKVLSGSANFSVRGLYAQSNNVFVFDDDAAAGLYEQAFTQAWEHPLNEFDTSAVASKWFPVESKSLPRFDVSFAPHSKAGVSLDRVAAAIRGAKSSVLFAIMEIGNASGPVMDEVLKLGDRKDLYAFGTTQKIDGKLKVTTPADPNSPFIPFGFLKAKVPQPFRREVAGGSGQIIHHKFVVVDFNGDAPQVFAGSSNLAAGGETSNGDNLVAFLDADVAAKYAFEAIRLIDHYRFRAVQKSATEAAPLRLKRRGEDWSSAFFDPESPRCRERRVFVGQPAVGP